MNIFRLRYFTYYLLFLLIFAPSIIHAGGPIFRHKDPVQELEFENVYQDLRQLHNVSSTTLPSGSTYYIQNTNSLQAGATAYPDFLKTGSATNPILDVNKSSVTANGAVELNSTLRLGKSGSYILGDPSFGTRINNSADTINVIIANNSGQVTKPNQPCFLVENGTGPVNFTGDGFAYTPSFPTEIYDTGNNFSGTTFTAPITGKYTFAISIQMENILNTHTDKNLYLRTSNRDYIINKNDLLARTTLPMQMSVIADMDTNDTAFLIIVFNGSTHTVDMTSDARFNFFSGTLTN